MSFININKKKDLSPEMLTNQGSTETCLKKIDIDRNGIFCHNLLVSLRKKKEEKMCIWTQKEFENMTEKDDYTMDV